MNIFLSSWFYGVVLWLGCLVVTFKLWGWLGIIIGLLLLGIGVVPIALIAAAFAKLWLIVALIILLSLIVWGTRFFGVHLLKQSIPIDFEDMNNNNSVGEVIDVESTDVDSNDPKES